MIDKKKFIKYAIAGSATFIFEYSSFIILYSIGFKENISHSLSFVLAIMINFYLLKFFVFQDSKKEVLLQISGYLILILINFILSNIIISLLSNYNINAYLSKILTMIIIIIWNFTIMNRLIFKSSK